MKTRHCNSIQHEFLLIIATCLALLLHLALTMFFPGNAVAAQDPWWDNTWPYRVSLAIDADGVEHHDKAATLDINFTALWQSIGVTGDFDPNSLRVVEVDAIGDVVEENVPFQFDPANSFDAGANARGTLTVILAGTTAANVVRQFYLYFGPEGQGYPAPSFAPMVSTSGTVTDAGFTAFKIETSTGDWYYHKEGGGFSSLNDTDGYDWISYSTASGADGDFRGIPNSVHPTDCGFFHPGRTEHVTSTVKSSGPVKVTIESKNLQPVGCTTAANSWKAVWDIYPTYARMRMIAQPVGKSFWFLYEGTPGGSVDAQDVVVWSDDATERPLSTAWCRDTSALGVLPAACAGNDGGDWSNEWAYFADKTLGRSLFLLHDANDTVPDAYALQLGNTSSMTVFGFGRVGNSRYFSSVPQEFYVGLVETTAKATVQKYVESARNDVVAELGVAEEGVQDVTLSVSLDPVSGGTVEVDPPGPTYPVGSDVTLTVTANPGWAFDGWSGDLSGNALVAEVTMTQSKSVAANFSQLSYTLAVNSAGNGTVERTPNKPRYVYGETVQLLAQPGEHSTFSGWSGDVTGTQNPRTVTITGNTSVTANFDANSYALDVSNSGGGSGTVTVDPDAALYVAGDEVQLTATPDADSAFVGWAGDAAGTDNPLSLEINANTSVVAKFEPVYSLTVNVQDSELADVTRSPDKPVYLKDETVTLTAVLADAVSLLWYGWSGDATGTDKAIQITMNGHKEVTATVKAVYYLEMYVSDGNGAIKASPVQSEGTIGPSLYVGGEEVTLEAIAAPEWRFVSWGGDLTSSDNPVVISMDKDRLMTARFVHTYLLTVNSTGPGSIQVLPASTDGKYDRDTVVTLEAVPAEGAEFLQWQGNLPATIVPSEPIIQFSMNADRTFEAVFGEASPSRTHVYLPIITEK